MHTQTQWNIKKILPFVTIWLDLEDIMLREIIQRKTSTVCSKLIETESSIGGCQGPG